MADEKFYYLSYRVTTKQPLSEDHIFVLGCAVTNIHPLTWIAEQAKQVHVEPWNLLFWAEIPKDVYEKNKEQLGKLED